MRNTLLRLFKVNRPKLQGINAYPLHDHDFGEIAWIDEGAPLIHQVNGEELEIPPRSILFIRAHDFHAYHGRENEDTFLVNIAFQWHIYEGLKRRYFPEIDIYGENHRLPKTLQLTESQLQTIRSAFLLLLKATPSPLHIERFLINLFAELFPLPEEGTIDFGDAPNWMQSAWHTIQRPEHLILGVPEFYRLCGRCPEHVSREFHKRTGHTVVQSINQLRMAHAAALLTGTTHEIVDISRECGFESLSHFYACFRKTYKVTPRAYRKQAQKQM